MVPTVSNGRKAVTISLLMYQTMSEAWALQEKLYKMDLSLQMNPFSVTVDSSTTGSGGGARSVRLARL